MGTGGITMDMQRRAYEQSRQMERVRHRQEMSAWGSSLITIPFMEKKQTTTNKKLLLLEET
ncbi:hypothetical protein KAR91_09780 [Candidatus Pacearchaeota archaeon]|nr:hypothetical protein [Candidatus Pacearchaeota archaeon]